MNGLGGEQSEGLTGSCWRSYALSHFVLHHFEIVIVSAIKYFLFAPERCYSSRILFWKCSFRFCTGRRLSNHDNRSDFIHHFDPRKLHVKFSQNTLFSIDFGYDCRSVLKHVLKSYEIFCDMHGSRKRVVGFIYTKQFVSRPIVSL